MLYILSLILFTFRYIQMEINLSTRIKKGGKVFSYRTKYVKNVSPSWVFGFYKQIISLVDRDNLNIRNKHFITKQDSSPINAFICFHKLTQFSELTLISLWTQFAKMKF